MLVTDARRRPGTGDAGSATGPVVADARAEEENVEESKYEGGKEANANVVGGAEDVSGAIEACSLTTSGCVQAGSIIAASATNTPADQFDRSQLRPSTRHMPMLPHAIPVTPG